MPVACAQAQSMARPVLKNEKRQAAAAAALEKEHPELQGQILAPEAPQAHRQEVSQGWEHHQGALKVQYLAVCSTSDSGAAKFGPSPCFQCCKQCCCFVACVCGAEVSKGGGQATAGASTC